MLGDPSYVFKGMALCRSLNNDTVFEISDRKYIAL